MPWRLTGVEFWYDDKPVFLHADGHAAAWACPCGGPVLFIYKAGRTGSHPTRRSVCQKCYAAYYLAPPHNSMPEPPMSMMPSGRMVIIAKQPVAPVQTPESDQLLS